MSIRKLDYQVPDPDERDYIFEAKDVKLSAETAVLQLPVYRILNQGDHGSCSGFGLTTNFQNLIAVVTGDKTFQASPLFNYTQSRILDSVQLTDDPGTTLRSACGNLRLSGECKDSSWPYTNANFSQIPGDQVYAEAFKLSRMITYFEVKRDRSIIKYILGTLNYFILIGFRVYPSYQTRQVDETGDIPMPSQAEITNGTTSGHALNIIGFDDNRQVYIIVNNYGTSWGKQGYGTLPYAYFENEDLVTEAKLLLPSSDFASKYAAMKTDTNPQVGIEQTPKIDIPYISLLYVFLLMIVVFTGFYWFFWKKTKKYFPI